ncbi:ATP-binding cassette domain-containing protein [Amylolactobacillus amylophilus]|uniref:ATP-binding cassette domain-containing protein n=1 Tax=Amylolactobacillus amylophilus TaxID=1603 RepID=UPI0006CF8DCF|nr:ATP-binding cassette domain-containing protein [Amylolactobacillus amylophilus]
MILGANGSGKSTLMNLLMGEYIAYRGKLTISGHTLKSRQQLQQYQTGIGYLPQDPTTLFVKDNVLDELRYGLPESSDSEQTILTGSKSFKLDSVLGQNPFDLSGGQQQVLGLLKVLLKKTANIISRRTHQRSGYESKRAGGPSVARTTQSQCDNYYDHP